MSIIMKKIIYLITGMLVVVFSSCSDYLAEDNKSNAVADKYYSTTAGYESLINAAYSTLRKVYGDNVEILIAGTDLYKAGRAGLTSQGLGTYQTLTPADNSVKDFYTNAYAAIKTCNDAIYYGEKFNMSATRIAEARFLRAYYYFQLVQQFGDVSIVTDHLTTVETNYPRDSAQNVYKFIISEMKAALPSLPVAPASFDGRVNKRVVNHYLALVFLTRGYETYAETTDFDNAIAYATAAIDGKSLTVPFTGKTGIFFPGNEKSAEIIFSVQYSPESLESVTKGNSQSTYFGTYLGGASDAGGDGMPYMNTKLQPTMRLYNLLAADPNDTRFAGTFMQELYSSSGKCSFYSYFKKYDTRSTLTVSHYYPRPNATQADVDAWVAVSPTTRSSAVIKWAGTNNWENTADKSAPCILKFSDPDSPFGSGTSSRRDIFLARLAETYLIRAEAYIKKNGDGDLSAVSDINAVRTRAGATSISASDATIDYILDERAREFAGEYNRWYDLKRTGKLVTLAPVNNPDIPDASYMLGKNGIYKILRPIPQDAVGLNKSGSQNPAY